MIISKNKVPLVTSLHWRVCHLCKSPILPSPWSQQKCQRPPVSPGGLTFRRDNSCECLQDKDIIHTDTSVAGSRNCCSCISPHKPSWKSPQGRSPDSRTGSRGLRQLGPDNGRNWPHLKFKSPAKVQLGAWERKSSRKNRPARNLIPAFPKQRIISISSLSSLLQKPLGTVRAFVMMHLSIKQPPLNTPAPNTVGTKHTVTMILLIWLTFVLIIIYRLSAG